MRLVHERLGDFVVEAEDRGDVVFLQQQVLGVQLLQQRLDARVAGQPRVPDADEGQQDLGHGDRPQDAGHVAEDAREDQLGEGLLRAWGPLRRRRLRLAGSCPR